MTIQEFDKKYNFHDSDIHSISYDGKAKMITIVFDFCYWMQNDYKKGETENGLLKVIFNGVDNYDGVIGDEKYEWWSVLDSGIKDGKYHFLIEDTEKGGAASPDYHNVSILANSVKAEDPRNK